MRLRSHLLSFTAALALTIAAVVSSTARAAAPDAAAVADTYGDVALAMYEDALAAAKDLQSAVGAFLAAPTEETLAAARTAWKASRVPYQQTEGYRFGNAIVDDWEGKVNAWPLDEGLIDYVDTALYGEESEENPLYTANVVANPELRIGPDVDRRQGHHAGAPGRLAAGGAGRRIERRHRLSRDRVPAVGPGPARHRGRVGRARGDRLRRRQMHQRQLRPARRLSEGGDGPARLRPRGDGRQLEGRRRRRARTSRRRAPTARSPRSSPGSARSPTASSPASA